MRRHVMTMAVVSLMLFGLPGTAFAQPANDDFDNATVVTEPLPFRDAVTTVEATTAADDPECAGNGHTVWYRYTPGTNGTVNANTFGSDYDTTLSVYAGERGALAMIGCNDDVGGPQSNLNWEVEAGTTYHLMVGSFGTSGGGDLSLTVQGAPGLDVSIDPVGRVNPRTGVAVVSGTISCSPNSGFGSISGQLTQAVGRFEIRGVFDVAIDGTICDGTPLPWTSDVTPESGKFAGGQARARVSAIMCEFVCTEDREEGTVRLRR